MVEWLADIGARLLSTFTPTSLFLVSLAGSSFFPLPPDTLLLTMVLMEPEKALAYAWLCTVGSVVGAVFGYVLGLWGGAPLLRRLARPDSIARVQDLFSRYQVWAIGIAGLTPLPYKIFAVGAGVFAINFRTFIIVSLITRGLRFFLGSIFVARYGEPMMIFVSEYFDVVSIAFVIVALVTYVAWRRLRGAKWLSVGR